MSIELKPCPFCGGESAVWPYEFLRGIPGYFVECFGCGAQGGKRKTDKEAIAVWNTRPIEDKLRASGIEAMRKAEENKGPCACWHSGYDPASVKVGSVILDDDGEV